MTIKNWDDIPTQYLVQACGTDTPANERSHWCVTEQDGSWAWEENLGVWRLWNNGSAMRTEDDETMREWALEQVIDLGLTPVQINHRHW